MKLLFPFAYFLVPEVVKHFPNGKPQNGHIAFHITRAIPWWRLWPKFENFSLLIDHSSYNKQAINHFVVDVRSTLGGQSTATPQKINLGQGQAQCPCNARWRLWLRTKVGSASESLQSPISVKCDRVLCQHLYIWWTTYC